MKKYNVVVRETGYVVCEDCTHEEAIDCLFELIHLDKVDRTYEKGFYAVVEA